VQKKMVIKGFRSFAPRFGITAVCWPGLILPLEFVFFPHALLYRAISMHHGARTSHHIGMPPALVGSSVRQILDASCRNLSVPNGMIVHVERLLPTHLDPALRAHGTPHCKSTTRLFLLCF
jgi:hypothetical protein